MSIEIIDKLKQKNNGTFKLIDLEDVDYDGTGTSTKDKIEGLVDNQITLVEDDTSMEGIDATTHDTLTTKDKTIIGGINEVNAQYKDIVKKNKYIHINNFGLTDTKENTSNTFAKAILYLNGSDKILLLDGKEYQLNMNPIFTNIKGIQGIKGKTIINIDDLEFQQFKIQNSNNFIVSGLTLKTTTATIRKFGAGLILTNCNNFNIIDNNIKYFSAQGILLETCKNARVKNNYIYETTADGIHCHRGCENVWITENIIENVGDDGIGCFTYTTDFNEFGTGKNKNIFILNNRILSTGNTALNYGAKGISVGGSEKVKIESNIIENTFNGGISILVDKSENYEVQGCSYIDVKNNTISNNKSSATLPPITVMNQVDGQMISNVTIEGNIVSNCHLGCIFVTTETVKTALVDNINIKNNNLIDTSDTNYGAYAVFRIKRSTNVMIIDNVIKNMIGHVLKTELDGLTDGVTFENNTIINCNKNKNAVACVELYGTNNIIKNNYIIDDNDNYSIHITLQSDGALLENNIVKDKNIVINYQTFATKRVLDNSQSILNGTTKPTIGTWKKGDIVYNRNAYTGLPLGWVCVTDGTPGIWEPFGQIGMRSTDIVTNLTPNFIGEKIRKWDTKDIYIAVGTTSSDWKIIT